MNSTTGGIYELFWGGGSDDEMYLIKSSANREQMIHCMQEFSNNGGDYEISDEFIDFLHKKEFTAERFYNPEATYHNWNDNVE